MPVNRRQVWPKTSQRVASQMLNAADDTGQPVALKASV
jgi:hypothetical protein